MDQEIINYIHEAQKRGQSDFEIKQNLLNAGWEASLVEQNFVFARAESNELLLPAPVKITPPPPITRPQQTAAGIMAAPPKIASAPMRPAAPNPIQTAKPFSPSPLSDQSFNPAPKKSRTFSKPVMLAAIFLGLVIVAGGAYGFYQYSNP